MAELPARIGAYEIQARLGMGGMAETFVALRRGPGGFAQRVCLKRIRQDAADDPELVRQFLAEAAVVARLRHAAITQVLDFGRDGDDYFMALELIEGVDLRELLERNPGGLAPELVQYIATELATALDFAHRAGGEPKALPIVHRDVSSSNVLLSAEGEVKLSDFGIARPLDAPQHTRTGIVKGKVPYLAPEYARSGRFDARSDLFSLGVLLYECLSGTRPHDGQTELETLERASRGQRAPLREVASATPAGLVTEAEALLEADPNLRTQSAAALLEALLALPAVPRARRELGALVTACRAARPASKTAATTAVAVGPTERWDAPGRREPAALPSATVSSEGLISVSVAADAPRLRVSRRALVALAVAVALSGAVLGFAATRGNSEVGARAGDLAGANRGDRSVETAVPADKTSAEEPTREGAAETASAIPGASPGQHDDKRKATLEVVVMPYGQVAINGEDRGRSPVIVRLAAGDHDVRAHNRNSTFARRVTLRPGEHKRVVLR
jgi:eukaryotic-like serine/threonine-protein kinase